jgi:predicted acetyltransferase
VSTPPNVEIRRPAEEDRERVVEVLATSLNFPVRDAVERKERFWIEDMRAAYVDGKVSATAGEYRFGQWFGGRRLACCGIWGVATMPELRGLGLASSCVGELMDEARRRGDAVTALYPAVLEPYRGLGYELAGTFDDHRIRLDALPASDGAELPRVEVVDPDRDLGDIVACYARWARTIEGAIEPDERFWRTRLLERPWDETFRAIVVRDAGSVTGVASFDRTADASGHLDIGFGLDCTAFVANDRRALRALIAYARGHRGIGRWLGWAGAPNDPLTMLVGVQAVEVHQRYRWMLRLLDVRRAFEGRGYPAIDATVTFAVDDPRYPDNAGPWTLRLEGGAASLTPASTHDRVPISINVLSSMFSGYLRPHDAARLGMMDADDPAVEVLAAILAAPDPWCPFFF